MIDDAALVRGAWGVLLATAIALAGRRAGSLSPSGAGAAVVAGTAATLAGWSWAVLLLTYFALTSLISHAGRDAKARRTAGMIEKGGRRDWRQVLANGGPFVVAAVASLLHPHPAWAVAGAGSIAAAAADSWATEVGTLVGGPPRSLTTWRIMPAGASGGVTLVGTAALVAGACITALIARAAGLTASLLPVALAGIGGAVADSLLGATVQERRHCTPCGLPTEARVHVCGAATRVVGGIQGCDNDLVNLLCSAVGGVMAVTLAG